MKLTHSWLAEFLPELPSHNQLLPHFDRLGLPLETSSVFASAPAGVVFAPVLAVRPLPGSALKVLDLELGDRQTQVVSAAPNAQSGVAVALALPGSELAGGPVANRSFAGQISEGMALSPAELGIGEYAGGLWLLPYDALAPGTPLAEAWQPDFVYDLEITPNRGDALSVLGVARDLAAGLGISLKSIDPAITFSLGGSAPPVSVLTEGCDHYLLYRATGDFGQPSPIKAQLRLFAAGMRPIRAGVDATNYTMLELGNPLHAFSAGLLGQGVVVREAQDGEIIKTLDGLERNLQPGDLLITARADDHTLPVALAGIMGAEISELSSNDQELVLESAHFLPAPIQRTAHRLGIKSEASYRYQRGVDPLLPPRAAQRALELLQSWCGAQVSPGFSQHQDVAPPPRISYSPAQANQLLGLSIAPEQQAQILSTLGCRLEAGSEPWLVQPPTYRSDLNLPEDLAEEVLRIYGYDQLPETPLQMAPRPDLRAAEADYRDQEQLRRLLSGLGFQEVINYPWINSEVLASYRAPEPKRFLVNPMAQGESSLRSALFPGIMQNLRANSGEPFPLLFELGSVFTPTEETHLALVTPQQIAGGGWDNQNLSGFFAFKGILEVLAARIGGRLELKPAAFAPLHPGMSAAVYWQGQQVGIAGELHPEIASSLELAQVLVCELRLPLTQEPLSFKEPSRFPPLRRDLAVVIGPEITYAQVESLIWQAGGPYLSDLELFDRYQGPPLATGQSNLAFHLVFRSSSGTLTDREISPYIESMVSLLAAHGITLRGIS